ncbi:putative pH-response regulator protein palA/RIM2 [Blumeria hordei DH14]|uniref:Putative pH-response regulator protein palA/RIM2 n=1 Tax=Blumeria graminis f. sp. hordei (strain DH14) TaxID=546991 RepID=N1JAR3_BLUG1|nr:putative pH-response regulator protein palA/RIM2 [Blumeria hordei DH14]
MKQYISAKYNQHPDMFQIDLKTIDALRRAAVQVTEPHVAGIKKIMAYAAQLAWIERKFPIDLGVDFVWYPAIGYNTQTPLILNNLKFERANILYNLAALYSQLAISSNRNTTEGLRTACNYFCLSAGILKHIKECILTKMQSTPPEDMDDATLEYLEQLFLAQAQECFWQKAVIDRYKDASIAKLAAKISDLYGSAGDWGLMSRAVTSEWVHHAIAKHYHFSAASQYRQACECLEKRNYGEEVARLRYSLSQVQDGLKEARYVSKVVMKDLNDLKNKVSEDLKRAERDNDIIYLSPVPPRTELRNLERVEMATSKIPPEVSAPHSFLGEQEEFGPPLFAKLVPFAVHIASSIFQERQDRLINNSIIVPLKDLNTKLHTILSSLSLPGSLQALEKPLGLPPTLASHAEEIRQSNAIARLKKSLCDSSKLAESTASSYLEAKTYMSIENSENENLKTKYGTIRWTRPDSNHAAPKLYAKMDEIDGYLKSASRSDQLVHEKFQGCEDLLHILASNDHELGKFIPNARRIIMPPDLEEAASKLRNFLNELSRVEIRRCRKIELLREKAKKDDTNTAIISEATRLEKENELQPLMPAHFEELLESRLSKYDSDVLDVKDEEEEQEGLIKKLKIFNDEFIQAKNGNDDISREREKVLQRLENAYNQHKEIFINLEAARKFYNDLGQILSRFREEVNVWVAQRREEATRLESDINLPSVSSLSINAPELKSQLQTRDPRDYSTYDASHDSPVLEKQTSQDKQFSSSNIATIGLKAQIPVEDKSCGKSILAIWNPEMGIKFSDANSYAAVEGPVSDKSLGKDNKKEPMGSVKRDGKDDDFNDLAVISNKASKAPQTWDPKKGLRFG